MGEVAYWQKELDVVTFLPAGAPWQKAEMVVSERRHRLEMTRLAIAGVPHFVVDDREVVRDGWTYTADTLRSFPKFEELILILGADAASRLPTWERYEEVMSLARVAVMPRPGVSYDDVVAAVGAGRFEWLDGPELDISGTDLRDRFVSGKTVRFLLPEAVRVYAETVGLHSAQPA